MSEYVRRFAHFFFVLLMCPDIKVRCFIRKSLPEVRVLIGKPFEMVQVGGGEWLVTAVFGQLLGFIVVLIDRELVGTFLEGDRCLEGVCFTRSRRENWKFLLHCFILIIKWLYISKFVQLKLIQINHSPLLTLMKIEEKVEGYSHFKNINNGIIQ